MMQLIEKVALEYQHASPEAMFWAMIVLMASAPIVDACLPEQETA